MKEINSIESYEVKDTWEQCKVFERMLIHKVGFSQGWVHTFKVFHKKIN